MKAEKLSAEAQLQQLRTFLSTCEPFRHCRGNLGECGWLGTDIVTKKKEPPSPNEVMRVMNWRSGQARVVLNHLAKLRRDGHMIAYEELLSALNSKFYVITGEELPLESRTPGVLLMFEPKRMLDLIRWVQFLSPLAIDNHLGRVKAEYDLNLLSTGLEKPRLGLKWLTESVLDKNPGIRHGLDTFYNSGMRGHRSLFLPSKVVWKDEDELQSWLSEKEDSGQVLCNPEWLRIVQPSNIGLNEGNFLGDWGVACFFPGKTQAEILGAIRRDLHDQVAVWQFHYPSFINNFRHGSYSIGLVPEAKLGVFKKECPTFTSNTITDGFGAVILENRRTVEHPMFDIRKARHSPEEPDFQNVAIELHFA